MTQNVAVSAQKTLTLSPKQEALIAALVKPLSIDAAAKVAGISDRTAHRWLKLPHFQAALKQAQHHVFDEALVRLQQGVGIAITTLLKQMTDPDTRPYVKVQAASIWLDKSIELHKMADFEEKVRTLEQLLRGRNA